MPVIPLLGPRDVVNAFGSFGWSLVRQSGSHLILVKEGHSATLSVPNHKQVARGTLRSLIRDAGLTVSEFFSAL